MRMRWTVGVTTAISHYSFGGLRIAVKRGNTLCYLHGDHLGSTSLTMAAPPYRPAARATPLAPQRAAAGDLQPDRTFTGQKSPTPAACSTTTPATMIPRPAPSSHQERLCPTRRGLSITTDFSTPVGILFVSQPLQVAAVLTKTANGTLPSIATWMNSMPYHGSGESVGCKTSWMNTLTANTSTTSPG